MSSCWLSRNCERCHCWFPQHRNRDEIIAGPFDVAFSANGFVRGGGHIGEPNLCVIQQEGANETAGGGFYCVADTKCCCASGFMAYDVSVDGGAFIWIVQAAQEGLFLLSLHGLEEFFLRFFYP